MDIAIKELGKIITGNTPSKKTKSFWDSEDICFVKPDCFEDDGITLIQNSKEYLSEKARSKARIVSKDAVFITCIGSIGKIGISSNGDYAFNQQINVIVTNEKVLPRYLAYNLLFSKYKLTAIANAPIVPIINKSQFGEIILNIEKSKEKQEKIVFILDRISEIISFRKKEIKLLDNLIKARFVEMFGDPILNPKGWKFANIGDIVTDVRYGTSKPAVEGGKYPYLRMNNLTYDGHLDLTDLKYIDISDDELENCIVRKGDILFNRTNSVELVGKTATFDLYQEMVIAGYIIRVRLNEKMLPEVFSQYMNHETLKALLRNMAKGAVNQANINAKELQNIKIYIPDIALQKQFVDIKDQIDKSKVAVQKALDETQMLFDSLMQKYFG